MTLQPVIAPTLEILAFALYTASIVSVFAFGFVLHWVRGTDLPVLSIRMFRAYFILGACGWFLSALRDIGKFPVSLTLSGAIYVACSFLLFIGLAECAQRNALKRIVTALHLLLIAGAAFLSDYRQLVLLVSGYAIVLYAMVAFIAGSLARKQQKIGHAIIAAAAILVVLGSLAQVYVVVQRNDLALAYGINITCSTVGFLLVGIGFLSAILMNEHQKMTQLALKDPLTGLLNRRGLEQSLFSLMNLSQRTGLVISAITIDIDHFKKINDTHGHDGGDIVLTKVAALLEQSCRSSDVCCRLGGEEFVLVLPATPVANAATVAEKIRLGLASMEIQVGNARVPVTASLGVASQETKLDLDALLKDADKALYKAKETGRNRVVLAPSSSERAA